MNPSSSSSSRGHRSSNNSSRGLCRRCWRLLLQAQGAGVPLLREGVLEAACQQSTLT